MRSNSRAAPKSRLLESQALHGGDAIGVVADEASHGCLSNLSQLGRESKYLISFEFLTPKSTKYCEFHVLVDVLLSHN